MSKRISVPESGKVGPVIHLSTRYGQVAKQLTVPRDPRTPHQLTTRSNFAFVTRKWQFLTPESQGAYRENTCRLNPAAHAMLKVP
jgi:hypothetical protein